MRVIVDGEVFNEILVYKAVISAAGLMDPYVHAVVDNTLGDIAWTRNFDGYYIGTLTGAFVDDKTFCSVSNEVYEDGTSAQICSLTRVNANTVKLKVFDALSGDFASNLNLANVKIEVYK
jgi:hypothetical protein